MKTHVLYIPGLGDSYDGFRSFSLRAWSLFGVTATHVPIMWYDKDSLATKLQRVQQAIEAVSKDKCVVLIGESAGATLALHTAKNTPRVSRVITLCGVTSIRTPISASLRRRAPALDEAVTTLPTEPYINTHSIRAFYDSVVGKRYSIAPGATSHILPTIGHLFSITLCLTILAPYIIAIAKSDKT